MSGESQTSDTVLLVRPASFGFHAEAAQSNLFAKESEGGHVAALALAEFEELRRRLEEAGVRCLVLDDEPEPARPDAVFPNNMVSFHRDGTIIWYPMATAARRLERRPEEIEALLRGSGFAIGRVVDLSAHEGEQRFLEGTGSLVLDRPNRKAYATLGPRTDPAVIAAFDEATGFSTMVFAAADRAGKPIYHTNVLVSLGSRYAILCDEAVAPADREALIGAIEDSGRTIIHVGFEQMEHFACNALELVSSDGRPLIALSELALASFTPGQRRQLEGFGELVAVAIPTIEAVGGGSVRCMIADVHLPKK